VIPCILLLLFTIALLWKLEQNKKRRGLITSGTSMASRVTTAKNDRTTKILIILLIIFLITEFPQGILAILNGLFPNDIHQFVYLSLGEMLDLLSLINCNTCFIVYPLISSQYRATLKDFWDALRYRRSIRKRAYTGQTIHMDTSVVKFLDDRDVLL
ncbi:Protein DMSR-4, partial [Aphelenchoides avenae]